MGAVTEGTGSDLLDAPSMHGVPPAGGWVELEKGILSKRLRSMIDLQATTNRRVRSVTEDPLGNQMAPVMNNCKLKCEPRE